MNGRIVINVERRWWFGAALYAGALLVMLGRTDAEALADWLTEHTIKFTTEMRRG